LILDNLFQNVLLQTLGVGSEVHKKLSRDTIPVIPGGVGFGSDGNSIALYYSRSDRHAPVLTVPLAGGQSSPLIFLIPHV
jgi:hypothetical protein